MPATDTVVSRTCGVCPAKAAEVTASPRGWLWGVLAATLLLNLLDAMLTLFVVQSGIAVEANPVMAAAFEGGPLVFALSKIALVSAGVGVLWRFRERPLAMVGSVVVFAAYAVLIPYQLIGIHEFASVSGV